MYWSTQLNEFFKHAIENPNLDYKATTIKFSYLNEGLCVTNPHFIQHIKMLESKIHYKNKN